MSTARPTPWSYDGDGIHESTIGDNRYRLYREHGSWEVWCHRPHGAWHEVKTTGHVSFAEAKQVAYDHAEGDA